MTDSEDEKIDKLVEDLAHLKGVVETDDKVIEHRLDSAKHGQMLLVGAGGLFVAVAVALLVYVLQRLDTIQSAAMAHH